MSQEQVMRNTTSSTEMLRLLRCGYGCGTNYQWAQREIVRLEQQLTQEEEQITHPPTIGAEHVMSQCLVPHNFFPMTTDFS